jgi:hypothetical protein
MNCGTAVRIFRSAGVLLHDAVVTAEARLASARPRARACRSFPLAMIVQRGPVRSTLTLGGGENSGRASGQWRETRFAVTIHRCRPNHQRDLPPTSPTHRQRSSFGRANRKACVPRQPGQRSGAQGLAAVAERSGAKLALVGVGDLSATWNTRDRALAELAAAGSSLMPDRMRRLLAE